MACGGWVRWAWGGRAQESLEEASEVRMRLTEEASQCSRHCREGRGGGKDWSKVAGQGWDGQEISVERQLQPPGPLISHGLLLQPWLGETCDRGLSGLLSDRKSVV